MGTIGAIQDEHIDPPLFFAAPTFRSISHSCRAFLSRVCIAIFDIQ
jgi:hypothetical protein